MLTGETFAVFNLLEFFFFVRNLFDHPQNPQKKKKKFWPRLFKRWLTQSTG